MTQEEAFIETEKMFGKDSVAEVDRGQAVTRYYVGECPKTPGPYTGFMGFSWEQALEFARESKQ